MSYSRVWKRLENFFSFQFKINARTMLCHPFMTVFLIGRQSALTSFYFHYLKILSYLWLCPCFGFFLQLKLSFLLWSSSHEAFQYCSTNIPAFEIQSRITGDPVVACVLPKISWCRSKTRSWEKKNPWKTFKTLHLLIICIKNHKYINHTKMLH